ncbi:MAG: RelA/SpoT domain-containing protein [Polyangiales bacterium]
MPNAEPLSEASISATPTATDVSTSTSGRFVAPALTEPQIAILVGRYKREMARYEKAGRVVGDRLRRELRQAGVKHMVSSRPKHPADLAEKLRKKSREKPSTYHWDALQQNLGDVVTDLAGCRVVVYSAAHEEVVGAMISRLFAQPPRADAIAERRRNLERAYWATHALVHPYSPGDSIDVTLEDAICELQVVTVAAHLFNEIEHDIAYKDRNAGITADDEERQLLVELRGIARVADRLVERLLEVRARRRDELATVISDAETLRYMLSQQARRPLRGLELGRLLSLLEQCLERVTPAALRELGEFNTVVAAGRDRLGNDADDEDETSLYVAGLLDRFEPEIAEAMKTWGGPATPMQRVIERAIERRRKLYAEEGT